VVGIVLVIVLAAANLAFGGFVLDRLPALVRPLRDWWQAGFVLTHFLLLCSLPVVCAALSATRDRIKAAQQTFSYCFSVLVLFALVCGRPLPWSVASMLVLPGVAGLAGVCFVALIEGLHPGPTR
jgi:hypothetical protein